VCAGIDTKQDEASPLQNQTHAVEVLINGRFLSRQMTGVDRFAHEIIRAIDRLCGLGTSPFTFRIVAPSLPLEPWPLKNIPISCVSGMSGHLWEQITLPRYAKDRPLISLCNTGPVFKKNHHVVIHDATTVAVPESFSPKFRLLYRILMPTLGMSSRSVLTVSNFARNDIASAFGIKTEPDSVLGEGGEHILRYTPDESVLQKNGLERGRYFLAVSSNAPHKNFRLILDAIELLKSKNVRVAIAGGQNKAVFGANAMNNADNASWLGYVSNEELRALYENATAFIFPSTHEGFGLPLVEAMQVGCPIIASNAASIPEVCGNAALFVDPRNPHELADAIALIHDSKAKRDQLSKLAKERSVMWQWDTAAHKLITHLANIYSVKASQK
jgi:glycosyltransferase involved in cell wall biosynthesis